MPRWLLVQVQHHQHQHHPCRYRMSRYRLITLAIMGQDVRTISWLEITGITNVSFKLQIQSKTTTTTVSTGIPSTISIFDQIEDPSPCAKFPLQFSSLWVCIYKKMYDYFLPSSWIIAHLAMSSKNRDLFGWNSSKEMMVIDGEEFQLTVTDS